MHQFLNFFAVFVVGVVVGWFISQSQSLERTPNHRAMSLGSATIASEPVASSQWHSQQFLSYIDKIPPRTEVQETEKRKLNVLQSL